MINREKFENGLFTIRFTGDNLKIHGVSIYDLSHSLLSLQRIMHKAYLAINGSLKKGAYPDREARKMLSLQIGERKRASDAFALIPMLLDPTVQEYIKQIAEFVVSGIVSYHVADVLGRIKSEKNNDKKLFIGSIHADVVNIVNRIDASGGVEGISIGAPKLQEKTIASFDKETKYYLSEIKDEFFLGTYQEIKGKVYKLYPASKIVAIRIAGGGTVSIFLSKEDFESIRYHKETNPLILFRGYPRYQFGIETKIITEFEADAIEYLKARK